MFPLVLAAVLAVSVQDQLDGAEIGDATQFVAFRSHGKYYAERADKGGKTTARGSWRVEGKNVAVKVDSCKGPACASLGRSWSAEVAVPAEQVMTLQSDPPAAPLASGSYYCLSQGCEKRLGVELVSHRQRAEVMQALLGYLTDRSRTRDVTAVWIGSESAPSQEKSSIEYCAREPQKAKRGAELVAADLGALPWFGKSTVPVQAASDCLYDVRVIVGDDVQLPNGK